MTVLAGAIDAVRHAQPMRVEGVVAALRGLTVMVDELPLPVGSLVSIGAGGSGAGQGCSLGEIVGFTREQAIVMLLGQTGGIRAGDVVTGLEVRQTARVGPGLLGRAVDGMARPLDGLGIVHDVRARPVSPDPIRAMDRRRITQPLLTGIRAVDLMTPLGKGQRMGIFAGPGVGKSTLLGAIARRTNADVNIIALIGERGREVKDFIEHCLGPEGLARSAVVVATSDESPLMRLRAARLACTAAESFRDQGLDVLLVMDSITRFAHAQRQVGLSVGEPPATKGYTPSVFANLALLLERAGALEVKDGAGGGTITGLYTILVEGDDMTEPIADAARGILDGHIVLARKLAQQAHYPAIDVLDSVSRVTDEVCDQTHLSARRQLLRLMALYKGVEDLVQIGAYARGTSPETDVAIDYHPAIVDVLRQGREEVQPFEQSKSVMIRLAAQSAEAIQKLSRGRNR